MFAQRLSFLVMTTLAVLSGAAYAQGPWPTLNQPRYFSPIQEFFTPRADNSTYTQPVYGQYPSTPIVPGVPQCANGRCRQACPNGQCVPSNQCANGQCPIPAQSNYSPAVGTNANCPNGQCRNRTSSPILGGLIRTQPLSQPNSSFGFRPLTPVGPQQRPANGGQVNRLVPLDGGFPDQRGVVVPTSPMYPDRESMIPSDLNYANDPTIKFQ